MRVCVCVCRGRLIHLAVSVVSMPTIPSPCWWRCLHPSFPHPFIVPHSSLFFGFSRRARSRTEFPAWLDESSKELCSHFFSTLKGSPQNHLNNLLTYDVEKPLTEHKRMQNIIILAASLAISHNGTPLLSRQKLNTDSRQDLLLSIVLHTK